MTRRSRREAAKARRRDRKRAERANAEAKATFFKEMATIHPYDLRRFTERTIEAKAARQRLILSEHCPPNVTHHEIIRRAEQLLESQPDDA